MILTRDQVAALDASARASFHADLLARLRPNLVPQLANLRESDLLARLETWQRRAIAYGISSTRSAGRFLGVHLAMLPDFDLAPEARPLLTNPALTGDNKMSLMFRRFAKS